MWTHGRVGIDASFIFVRVVELKLESLFHASLEGIGKWMSARDGIGIRKRCDHNLDVVWSCRAGVF